MASKSLFITYILWLFGGFFGLHHFYLERDYHAFIWLIFCGGYFGAGWLRDLWRIPEYVKDANEEPSYMAELAEKMIKEETPHTGSVRYFGMLMVADTFGYLVIGAIPKELMNDTFLKVLSAVLAPFASAMGVYVVGNIGRHEGRLVPAIIGAYLTSPLYFMVDSPLFLTSLFASYVFNSKSKQWRRTRRPKRSLLCRITFIIACGIVYLLLWGSWLYFNCKLIYQDEGEVKCRDAAKHFLKSPIWQEFITVMKALWETVKVHGWHGMWEQIVEAFDPVGEAHALKVLELNETATQQEITTRYRKLSREWHPDKHKDPEAKNQAQEKFIEIQQAYETLSQIKSQRVVKNIENRAADGVNQEYHEEL